MTLLLLQMAVILVFTYLCGQIAQRLGQARVIGEMAGGILLGPSVFGRLVPHASSYLFPAASLHSFEILSNVGLILFLFLIGTELDLKDLARKKLTAAISSGLSIFLPFSLALLLASPLRARFAANGVSYTVFALFLGISFSITAFPVLARLLQERGWQHTTTGATALMCAAVDDVVAWTLLAFAMSLLPSGRNMMPMGTRMFWMVAYLACMLLVVRPLARSYARGKEKAGISPATAAMTIAFVFLSAAATDAIGIHPLFGAFVAGLCFPRGTLWQFELHQKLDLLVSTTLLPMFFALTGLRTRLDLLSNPQTWLWSGIVIAAAVAGKMLGAAFGARLTGETWSHSWVLGVLLNTRGLVELIVLNIAYTAHIFSPELFSMLVLMALVTTAMTTPLLNLLGGKSALEEKRTAEPATDFAQI